MGDTGSLILGVVMVILVIKFNEFNINQTLPYAISAAPVVSIGLLVIPIFDTIRVFFIRLSEKRSPFSPDMNHIHHNFVKLGNSHLISTLYIVAINILFICFTFTLGQSLSINNLLISVFALGLIVTYVPCLILKWKQPSTKAIAEKSVSKNGIKRTDIITEPALSRSYFIPDQSDIRKKKVTASKELMESAL
jgi:hypothetical protein